MLIGVDATCWWNQRGFGRFTRELMSAMFDASDDHRYCLFIDQDADACMAHPHVEVHRVRATRAVTRAAVAKGSRSIGDMWAMRRAILSQPLDVMFFPAIYSWVPVPRRVRTVVTLHDAIAEDFPDLVFPDLRSRLFWKLKMNLACRQAARILTVSQASKDAIIRNMHVNPGLIDYIYEAAGAHFRHIAEPDIRAQARARAGLPADAQLIVFVGGFAPHKNLSRLIAAYGEAMGKGGMADVHLAFVGDPEGAGFHSNFQELQDQITASPALGGRVHFTGFVSDEDLVALYSDSLVIVMPSLFEGFGLPAIEAMACGTPVLASKTGALPEVVGDAGLYFDPMDVGQIATTIHRVATEPGLVETLAGIASRRAKTFTWTAAADTTLKVLGAVGSGR